MSLTEAFPDLPEEDRMRFAADERRLRRMIAVVGGLALGLAAIVLI